MLALGRCTTSRLPQAECASASLQLDSCPRLLYGLIPLQRFTHGEVASRRGAAHLTGGGAGGATPRKHLCNKHRPSARPQFALPILWWRAACSACVTNQARGPPHRAAWVRGAAGAHAAAAAAAAAGRQRQRPLGAAPGRAAPRALRAGRLDGAAHLPHADDTVGVACMGEGPGRECVGVGVCWGDCVCGGVWGGVGGCGGVGVGGGMWG